MTLRILTALLVIHGAADTLVPPEHSRRLVMAANEPKRLLIVPDADHNDVFVRGGPALWRDLRDFFTQTHPPSPAHGGGG